MPSHVADESEPSRMLEAIVPKRIVLTRESAERVRDLVERPPEPTAEMRRLFDDR